MKRKYWSPGLKKDLLQNVGRKSTEELSKRYKCSPAQVISEIDRMKKSGEFSQNPFTNEMPKFSCRKGCGREFSSKIGRGHHEAHCNQMIGTTTAQNLDDTDRELNTPPKPTIHKEVSIGFRDLSIYILNVLYNVERGEMSEVCGIACMKGLIEGAINDNKNNS